ncbi:preprotein translocase subunit SecE [Mycobacterium lepromatosis]|uniref:Protein translocase subunit SecE n=1 Tax=Mycobacterium lepromatosis TaxID=480418 RepID=A0A0F4EQ07_9MYCO|nr:preprotein translocase subunit SecE [Mycobacterium lepromatosis]KJX74904.1 pre protein translocase subunit SecE [Mycobacterium lepromatosis]UKN42718.1 protein translocase subunit SecE [Mycobacterium lepromatosis]
MSDEGYVASDGGGIEDGRGSCGRTAVVTKPVTRPQRPIGKRSRQRAADAADTGANVEVEESSTEAGSSKGGKAKKPKKSKDRSTNPIVFIYNYLKQVVAEMRKVIWPNRKQMLTYTSVVLAFLAFMVALVGLTDFGLAKLVLLVFG